MTLKQKKIFLFDLHFQTVCSSSTPFMHAYKFRSAFNVLPHERLINKLWKNFYRFSLNFYKRSLYHMNRNFIILKYFQYYCVYAWKCLLLRNEWMVKFSLLWVLMNFFLTFKIIFIFYRKLCFSSIKLRILSSCREILSDF